MAWHIGKLPEFSSEVARLISHSNSMVDAPKQSNYSALTIITKRLRALYGITRAREEQFLSCFRGATPQEKLQDFQTTLNTYVRQVNFLINDDVDFKETQQDIRKILKQPIEMVIHNSAFATELVERLEIGERSADLVMDILQNIRMNDKNIQTRFIRKRNGKSVGLKKSIEQLAEITYENNQIKVSFRNGFPSKFEKTLRDEYNVIQTGTINNKAKMSDYLKKKISSTVTDPVLQNNLLIELRNFDNKLLSAQQAYDVNSSTAAIAGFLGEIAYTAILNTIFKNTGIPTGTMRKVVYRNGNMVTNGEIPIDLVVNGVGFQIKNYSILENTVTFGHRTIDDKVRLVHFIQDRARVGGALESILLTLFGSLQYNQKVTELYTQREPLVAAAQSALKVFEGYTDNILKVSDEFQSNIEQFASKNLYFNSFFIVGKKIVPASSIIQTIINQLNAQQSSVITSSFEINPIDPSGGFVYTGLHFGHHLGADYVKKAANFITMNYKITLNLNQVIANF